MIELPGGPERLRNVNVTYYWYVRSKGTVNVGNTLTARFDSNGNWLSEAGTFTHSSGGGTFDIQFTSNTDLKRDIWRAYNAGIYALYRHAGGVTNTAHNIRVGASSNVYSGGNVNITGGGGSGDGAERKFTVVHEMGHRITDLTVGGIFVSGACNYDEASPCPSFSTDSHSMGSRENNSCALQEGVAHFYAADVFNDHNELDCVFRYYKNEFGSGFPTVDCEAASSDLSVNGPFELAFMETNCTSPFTGAGVEVDWLRQLWDVHTNGASPDPTFTEMMQWMDAANNWTTTTAYSELDAEANTVGGDINSNWDSMKGANGVDH